MGIAAEDLSSREKAKIEGGPVITLTVRRSGKTLEVPVAVRLMLLPDASNLPNVPSQRRARMPKFIRNPLPLGQTGGKLRQDISLLPKEGMLMRMRILLPVLLLPALLAFSAGDARAGSFFGPDLYGARYTARYPNRSHNVFGCGSDCRCSAWHGFCRHRFVRRHRGTPNEGMPANVMPGNAMPGNAMPGNAMPITAVSTEYMHGQMPITQLPMATVPVRMTSGTPAQVVATPAVQSRIVPVPVPAPLPSGPVTAEPPRAEPPF